MLFHSFIPSYLVPLALPNLLSAAPGHRYAQTIFTLSEYVETKGRETDYEALKDACMGMAGSLNGLAKEAMAHQATNLSDAPLSGAQFAQY